MNPLQALNPMEALCNILQAEMGLEDGQVYFYNSKIQPITDDRLYVAVGLGALKPFANVSKRVPVTGGFTEELTTHMWAQCTVDILSRSEEALNRKEEIIMALGSNYAKQVQEAQPMMIARISSQFANLSQLEGSAIPYRFQITVAVQYKITKTKPIPFYSTFPDTDVTTEA